MGYDLDELEAAVVAVHAVQLPIPAWWPDEERVAFIADHAGYAFGVLVAELSDIVDRVTDRAAGSAAAGGRYYSAEEISDLIAIDQQVLLDEARSDVQSDLSEEIARTSGALLMDLLIARSRRGAGPGRGELL